VRPKLASGPNSGLVAEGAEWQVLDDKHQQVVLDYLFDQQMKAAA
jgi:hypothetical protein